jgi:hypothetical protein
MLFQLTINLRPLPPTILSNTIKAYKSPLGALYPKLNVYLMVIMLIYNHYKLKLTLTQFKILPKVWEMNL